MACAETGAGDHPTIKIITALRVYLSSVDPTERHRSAKQQTEPQEERTKLGVGISSALIPTRSLNLSAGQRLHQTAGVW
ncbi:unnamed protein product [Nippostrongylus brasiliensis]|uniref:Uncharacterized protein n=1 Tax=Nippostrongylus brasiliensis TaxID=27835 RepID=A0A0N4XCC2_NIPBR|nr:unnamed protein product [Nippostrongylus brasiliensis]